MKDKNICKHCGVHHEPVRKAKKNYCPDCGGAQVNHKVMYISSVLGSLIDPWTNWMANIMPEEKMEWVGPGLVKFLTFLKLGHSTHKPNEKDSWRTKVIWEEADKRGIRVSEFHPLNTGGDMFLSYFGKNMRFYDVMPRPKNYNPDGLKWMDNKNKMKQHFAKAGIPVARGAVTASKKKALEIFNSLSKPVITKPNTGSRSRHTTTHLSDEAGFLRAFELAQQLSPWVMIEEELSGFVFRGTLIDQRLAGVLRREPAYVIGDGIHSIKELIDIENKNPIRQGPLFHQIVINEDVDKELKHWNRTLETVPNKDEVITLGQKTSRAVGGGITDVTDIVHPDNKELLEYAASVVNDPLIGIDFIMQDVSVSWKDQEKCGILECNSAPFIDLHHYPLVGKPRNIAGLLWDIVYPESKL